MIIIGIMLQGGQNTVIHMLKDVSLITHSEVILFFFFLHIIMVFLISLLVLGIFLPFPTYLEQGSCRTAKLSFLLHRQKFH